MKSISDSSIFKLFESAGILKLYCLRLRPKLKPVEMEWILKKKDRKIVILVPTVTYFQEFMMCVY